MSKKRNKNAGSLIDFQIVVENHEVLDSSILALNEDWKEGKINWYSPKKDKTSPIEDTWCKEFKDKSFWDGKLDKDSNSFWDEMGNPNINRNSWPKGGPSWDGIAVLTDKNGDKILLLFEAKAQYAIIYVPMMLPYAAFGMKKLMEKVTSQKKN